MGFLYRGGTYTSIPGPSGAITAQVSGINDNGQIIGYYESSISGLLEDHGFLLSGSSYAPLNVPNQPEQQLFGINNNAWVVGGFGFNVGAGFMGMPTVALSVTSVTPNVVPAGLSFEMTVNGTRFLVNAVVQWKWHGAFDDFHQFHPAQCGKVTTPLTG